MRHLILYIVLIFITSIKLFCLDNMNFTNVIDRLAAMRGMHPRLYITGEKITELKSLIAIEPYKTFYRELKSSADSAVKKGAPKYILHDSYSGDEQLWERDEGNMIPHLALVYLLSDDETYLRAAVDYMLAACSYPTWGLNKSEGVDLAAGHELFGLALGYDWLYSKLTDGQKISVRDCLSNRTSYIFDRMKNNETYWNKESLQNHQWVNMTGIAASGLALYGDAGNIDAWITLPLEKYKVTMASLGSDGASHEGLPYWTYGLEYMLKFMALADDLLGEDLFTGNEWFINTAYFRIYGCLPADHLNRRSDLMSFADGPRYDWYGPSYMLKKLASVYNNPYAQYFSDFLDEKELNDNNGAGFLNLLWYDSNVKPVPISNLPLFRYFDDMGIIYSRSGWDGNESVYEFKCGPYMGNFDLSNYSYDAGGGHVHPDAGSFQIFAGGDYLITSPGYTLKETAYENTALINGIGQTGEGGAWFNGSMLSKEKRGPEIIKAFSTNDYDYVSGDVTEAYKEEAGLEKFTRDIVFIKPSSWLVVDRFRDAKPSYYSLLFHSDFPFTGSGPGYYEASGSNSTIRIMPLVPGNDCLSSQVQDLKGVDGNVGGQISCLTISNKEPAGKSLFITLLETYPSGLRPLINESVLKTEDAYIVTLRYSNINFVVTVPQGGSNGLSIGER